MFFFQTLRRPAFAYTTLPSTLTLAVQVSDEEMKSKKRFGRMQKAMGDYCLLAGSWADAGEHFTNTVHLADSISDHVWLAAAQEGLAATKA